MKKLSLLLVVLLAAGSAGLYGQMAIGTNFSISGDATATVGYDIDDEQFGFKNESNSNISIGFVFCQNEKGVDENEDGMIGGEDGKCSTSNEAMDGWYGSIALNDFRVILDSDEEDSPEFLTSGERYDTDENPYLMPGKSREDAKKRTGLYIAAPTIVAKLKNGPLFLQIFSEPESKADLIAHIEEDKPSVDKLYGDVKAESHDKDEDVGLDLSGPGIKVGYTTGDLTFVLGVASEKAYDYNGVAEKKSTRIVSELVAEKPLNQSSHIISAELKVNVGAATLDLAFAQGLENGNDLENCAPGAKPYPVSQCEAGDKDDDTGVGAKLTTDFGDVSLSAGADIHMTGDEDIEGTDRNEAMDWEVGGNATVTLTEHTSLKSNFIHSTLAATATDVKVSLSDKSGLVQDLDVEVTWGLFDITGGMPEDPADPTKVMDDVNDKSDLFVEADVSYAIYVGETDDMDDEMMMKSPKLIPGTKVTVNQLDGGDAIVALELRALLENVVPATTFGLKWKTGQLVDSGDFKAKQGTVTLWTKIAY